MRAIGYDARMFHRFGLPLLAIVAACGGHASMSANVQVGGGDTTPKETAAPRTTGTAPEPPPPAPTVAIARGTRSVGAGMTERIWIGRTVVFQTQREGAAVPVTIEHVSGELDERREQIAATGEGGTPTKLAVSFLAREATVVENGRERKMTSPVQGKSYSVERKDGTLYITTDKGGRVTRAEGDTIARGYDDLEGPEAFVKAIPEHPVRVGEDVPGLAAALEEDLARASAGTVGFGQASSVLRGTRDVGGTTLAVFAVQLDLAYKFAGVENRAQLSGELLVRTSDGMPQSFAAEGPIQLGGETRAGSDVAGDGQAKVTISWAAAAAP